jgi:hypothetical protein
MQLKELLRQAIYEAGETKRHNKLKKRQATQAIGFQSSDRLRAGRDSLRPNPMRSKPEERAWKQDPDAYWQSKGINTGGTPNPVTSRKLPTPDDGGVTPGPKGPRIPAGSPAPVNVINAVRQGGKVVFGRYYDGQGNYLGRSQGGQWVANKQVYAPDDTQMEMYNKIKEIESKGYTAKDKEMVKEMIREIKKRCGD